MQVMEEFESFTHLFHQQLYLAAEPETLTFLNLDHQPVPFPVMLLLLKNAFDQDISEADFGLLKKLSEWIGVENEKVACHLLKETGISFSGLRTKHHIENIICYGAEPADLGLNMDYQLNKPLRFMNCNMLFTAPFAEVQRQEAMKKQFFEALKILFSHLRKPSR